MSADPYATTVVMATCFCECAIAFDLHLDPSRVMSAMVVAGPTVRRVCSTDPLL